MRFKDKVAIITGASRGIGKAIAIAMAKEGCDIVVAGKTDQPDPRLPGTLQETVQEVEAQGRRAMAIRADVRFEDQVGAMVGQAILAFGRIDYMLNNAGAIFLANVGDTPIKRFDLVLGVNARAAFLCSQAVIPHMRKLGGGHILMMSPPLSLNPAPGMAAYALSKFGMTLLALSLAEELRTDNIACNALWPVTAIDTQATRHFGLGSEKQWRTADIIVEATLAILARHPGACTGNAYLDEDVLKEEGITDFSGYSVVPGTTPPPLSAFFLK